MRVVKWWLIIVCFFLSANIYAKEKTQKTQKTPEVYTEDQLAIAVTKDNPDFSIKLKSNPSTGFSWFLREYNPNLMTPNKYVVIPPEKKLVGASGYEVWTFHMTSKAFVVPQQTMIRFVYARPWSANDQTKQLAFRVSTD
jgi:inhibitor of cysteine peptidase